MDPSYKCTAFVLTCLMSIRGFATAASTTCSFDAVPNDAVLCSGTTDECVLKSQLCDSTSDCASGWDENTNLCQCGTGSGSYQVYCQDSSATGCINKYNLCNHNLDCDNGWDENSDICGCPGNEFMCANGVCIRTDQVCDTVNNNCGGSDVTDEGSICGTCYGGQIYCSADNTCVQNSKLCDGTDDCSDGFDESMCGGTPDADECSPSPCLNGATCVDLVGSYECVCAAGFTGVNCEDEFDYLYACYTNPCGHFGTCNEVGDGTYTCTCSSGFEGADCDQEIDECATSPCQNSGVCVDQLDGYYCSCPCGYTGNECQDIDYNCYVYGCENGGTCDDAAVSGVFECTCPSGFYGGRCQVSCSDAAFDVNGDAVECFGGAGDCPDGYQCRFQNGGAPGGCCKAKCLIRYGGQGCTDTAGKYYYDVYTGQCEVFPSGRCGKTKNTYDNLLDCTVGCGSICEEAVTTGSCSPIPAPRYYYNQVTSACESYAWFQCDTTNNHFTDITQCELNCL